MKNYLSITLLLTIVIIMGATTQFATSNPSSGGQEAKQEKRQYKNLKVLPKDMSETKLDSVMANWSVSLGVKCNFCHAASADTTKKGHLDFASDAKEEKGIARYMHNMTVDINDKFFSQTHSEQPDTIHAVMCYTCHRGSEHVDSKMFLSQIDSTIQTWRKKK